MRQKEWQILKVYKKKKRSNLMVDVVTEKGEHKSIEGCQILRVIQRNQPWTPEI